MIAERLFRAQPAGALLNVASGICSVKHSLLFFAGSARWVCRDSIGPCPFTAAVEAKPRTAGGDRACSIMGMCARVEGEQESWVSSTRLANPALPAQKVGGNERMQPRLRLTCEHREPPVLQLLQLLVRAAHPHGVEGEHGGEASLQAGARRGLEGEGRRAGCEGEGEGGARGRQWVTCQEEAAQGSALPQGA